MATKTLDPGFARPVAPPETITEEDLSGEEEDTSFEASDDLPATDPEAAANNAYLLLISLYPWMSTLGMEETIRSMIQDQGITDPTAILTEIRKLPGYQAMFPGIFRDDGTMRFTEAAYLTEMDNYRGVLQQFGLNPDLYSNDQLAEFLESEIDTNELRDRLTIYDQLTWMGQDIRDAFYVYAGIRLSDDDLYNYVVDPTARDALDQEYNTATAAGNLDYDTFIQRATDAGLDRVLRTLERLQRDGVGYDAALAAIRNIDPEFARQMTNVVYANSDGTGPALSLSELTNAFQVALIGGAASQQGLSLPSLDRINAIRSAGVTRARALEQYGLFAQVGGALRGQALRLNEGATGFSQSDFEEAIFLHEADASELLRKAQAREAAFGAGQGSAAFSTRPGGLAQIGLEQGRF